MRIAIIVPFFNEADNLPFLIKEWEDFLVSINKLKKRTFFYRRWLYR